MVVHGVQTERRASVTSDGASRSRTGFGRRICDVIPITVAATLEGMVQPNPVSDFVRKNLKAAGCVTSCSVHHLIIDI